MGVLNNELSNENECSVKVIGDIVELEINGLVICKSIRLWHNLALREQAEQRAVESKDTEPMVTSDRFEQLAKQASFNIYKSDLWQGTGQRFAESIVRECIAAIYKSQSITPGFLINLPPDQLAFQIKKHFGVD